MTTVKSVQTQIESLTKNMGKDRGSIVPKLNKNLSHPEGWSMLYEEESGFVTLRPPEENGMFPQHDYIGLSVPASQLSQLDEKACSGADPEFLICVFGTHEDVWEVYNIILGSS
jgi:hypothetical protein